MDQRAANLEYRLDLSRQLCTGLMYCEPWHQRGPYARWVRSKPHYKDHRSTKGRNKLPA